MPILLSCNAYKVWFPEKLADEQEYCIEFRLLYTLKSDGVVYSFFGEGNGIPLQYSCLENPMDGGAW